MKTSRALLALCTLTSLVAQAAQPQFTPLSASSLARAKTEGKVSGRVQTARTHTELRATLGADGKVRLECVTKRGSAFPSQNATERSPPTEAK